MSLTNENTFETAIVCSLVKDGGYDQGNAIDYNPETGMFENENLGFLKE